MMKYEDKSDFEINGMVAVILGSNKCSRNPNSKVLSSLRSMVMTDFGGKDFCNNPSDAWPIIVDNGMDIETPHPELGNTGTVTIYNPSGTDWYIDFKAGENPLRAAMIVFLKMREPKS